MKHLLILNYEYPPLGGGAGIMSQQLAVALSQMGCSVAIITAALNNDSLVETVNDNLTVYRLPSQRKVAYQSNVFEMLDWMRQALKFISGYCSLQKPEVLLCNFSFPGGYIGGQIKKRLNIPYVIISHGHDIPWLHPRQMFFYHLGLYFFIQKICSQSIANIVLTQAMKANIDRLIPKQVSKNIIIPNGVDFETILPKIKPKDGVLRLLFSGRFTSQKQPLILISALQKVALKIKVQAIMLGDGSLKDKAMQEAAAVLPLNTIIFKGKLNREEALKYFATSHVYISTSLNEAMSLSLIEAAASGTYILSTRVSGTQEIIREHINGNYITADADSLADAILHYYESKFLSSYTIPNALIEDLKQQYDIKIVAQQYHQILSNLLKT